MGNFRRRHARFGTWLHGQSFIVRWVVLMALEVAIFGTLYGISFALGQQVPLSSAIGMAITYPLFAAMFNKQRPPQPNAWIHRRFPRVYKYFQGLQNEPDARLSRFKAPRPDG